MKVLKSFTKVTGTCMKEGARIRIEAVRLDFLSYHQSVLFTSLPVDSYKAKLLFPSNSWFSVLSPNDIHHIKKILLI